MSKQHTFQALQRMQAARRYKHALECGDFAIVASILSQAEADSQLEAMVRKIDRIFQAQEGIVVHADQLLKINRFIRVLHETTYSSPLDGTSQASTVSLLATSMAKGEATPKKTRPLMTTNTSTIPPIQRTTPSAAKKRTRFSHLSRFAQMAAAVLVVGALLAGFLILFSQHSGTRTGASPTPPPGMYISRLGSVTHIDTRSHKVLWQTHLTDPSVPLVEPVAIGNAVYVLRNLTSLIALNAQTGTLLWTKTFPQQMLPLALDHGLLYLGAGSSGTSTDKILYVVDPETGSIITTYTPQGAQFWSDMILVDGILYYGDQTLYAMQISNGKLLWRQHTGNTQSNIGGTVVQDGIIYTTVTQIGAKHNGWIDAFSARTGEKLWQSPAVILAGGLSELAATSTMLYASSRSNIGKLLAFDIQTHALVWQKTIDATHLLATSNILYVR
ncbi:MAG TPA: PQQ-binding-like beta-propeller repeat protein, partial [Ktedonobacteraceae bacterium]|nr:PQQ-binding-like beta-propeller repeat protein [Ktedonobacteraceae bacterium]